MKRIPQVKQKGPNASSSVADVLRAPPDVLSDAIDSLLRRPTPLSQKECVQVGKELTMSLLRCEEVLSLGNFAAFDRIVLLLQTALQPVDASNTAEDSVVAQVQTSTEIQDRLSSIMATLLSVSRARKLQDDVVMNAINFVSLLTPWCSRAEIKEVLGKLLMDGLLTLLSDVLDSSAATLHYELPRMILCALINLVKNSKDNKQRPTTWGAVARSAMKSLDAFHQMQCVELLFRVTRQPKGTPVENHPLLRIVDFSQHIPRQISLLIAGLPTDEHLIEKILEAVFAIQQCQNQATTVLQVSLAATSIDFHGHRLAMNTHLFFNASFVVAILRSSDADNITIPYRDVKSIRMLSATQVQFKLSRLPANMNDLVTSDKPDEEYLLLVTLPKEDVAVFKAGPIRSWIMAARSSGTQTPSKRQREEPQHASGAGSLLKPMALFPDQGVSSPVADASPVVDSPVLERIADSVSSREEAEIVLTKMREYVEHAVQKRRMEALDVMQNTAATIQALVDEQRQETTRSIENLVNVEITAAVKHLQSSLTQIDEALQAAVGELHSSVSSIRSSVIAANDTRKCLDLGTHSFVEGSRESELQFLKEFKRNFDSQLQQLEEEANAVMQERSGRLPMLLSKFHSAIDESV